MAARPAALAGLSVRKGRIAVGCDADLAVFAPERSFNVSHNDLYFRHRFSPYVGEGLRGIVCKTYVRGRLVFDEGSFPGEPIGREVLR